MKSGTLVIISLISDFTWYKFLHFLASSVLKSRYVIRPAVLHPEIATTQTMAYLHQNQLTRYCLSQDLTCTASRKKLRLNAGKDRMYLLATVIMMDDAQYDSTGGIGLSFRLICGAGRGDKGFTGSKLLPCFSPNSISFPSRNLFFSASAIVKIR